MRKGDLLKLLKNRRCLIKNKYLRFTSFDLFLIDKIYSEKRDFEDIWVLESEGKKFEYWISQNLFIPPWETHWFQLRDNFLLKLKNNGLSELINAGIKRAGNTKKFSEAVEMSYPTFYNFTNNKGIFMVSVKKLKKILSYLGKKYKEINSYIEFTKKGGVISIVNPNFPFNLASFNGAALLGMIVSDGCIYIDKKARNCIRTKYSSGEKESVNNFIRGITQIFGKTHIQKENIRNCNMLKIGSSIIGDSLLKVGAILGCKAKIDGKVPWLIRYGNRKLKCAYLQSVFDDESSVYCDTKKVYKSYIILSRYKHLKSLTENERILFEKLEKFMSSRELPTRHINKSISIKKAIERINENKSLIRKLNSAPKLLLDESFILNELGVENRLFGRSLNKTHLGNYSVCFDLFINKKDGLKKFYKGIGFSIKDKQNKLSKIVRGGDGVKAIQYLNTKKGNF